MSAVVKYKELIESNTQMIQQALPVGSNQTAERVVRSALMQISASKDLQACSPHSLLRAVIQAASVGLEISTILAEAYLVPYKGHCQLIPGYRGLAKLAFQGLAMTTCEAKLVYVDDFFEVHEGTNPQIIHRPNYSSPKRGDADIVAGYFVATLREGGQAFEVMTRADVEKRRKASKMGNSGPWKDWYPEMFKKTLIRNGIRILPRGTDEHAVARLYAAVELDNRFDTQTLANPNEILDVDQDTNDEVQYKTKNNIKALKGKILTGDINNE